MSGSPIITAMTIVFSITTVAVVLFPVIKLLPSRLERRVYRQIAFHRDATAQLAIAIARSHDDRAQHQRLTASYEYHRRALLNLSPGDVAAPMAQRADAA